MESSKEKRIRDLIDLCLRQKETDAQRKELESFFKDATNEPLLQKIFLSAYYQNKSLDDLNASKQEEILSYIHSFDEDYVAPKNEKIKTLSAWVAAAAVLLIVLLPFLIERKNLSPEHEISYRIEKENEVSLPEPSIPEDAEYIDHQPAAEKARFVFANGESLDLETIINGEEVTKEGVRIEKLKEGILSIQFDAQYANSTSSPMNNKQHTVVTPRGGTYEVMLADGTEVFLNSDSKLSFPAQFQDTLRAVELEGEGYFKVAKDANRRFVVRSGYGALKQEIEVYGTEFNLRSYRGDEVMTTTLVEGSVKIKNLNLSQEQFLKPMEESLIGKKGLDVRIADMDASLAWKNNLFYFADEPLESVMNQISRWYDIDVKYVGVNSDARIWGQVSREKTLSHILDVLERSNGLHFQVHGKEIRVHP